MDVYTTKFFKEKNIVKFTVEQKYNVCFSKKKEKKKHHNLLGSLVTITSLKARVRQTL